MFTFLALLLTLGSNNFYATEYELDDKKVPPFLLPNDPNGTPADDCTFKASCDQGRTAFEIRLYILSGCQYCQKIIKYLKATGNVDKVRIIKVGTDNLSHFIDLSGKEQFPFLHDTQKQVKMFESDDIIAYLKQRFLHL